MNERTVTDLARILYDDAKRRYLVEGDPWRRRIDPTPLGLPIAIEIPINTPFSSQKLAVLTRVPADANAFGFGERVPSAASRQLYIQIVQFFRITDETYEFASMLPGKDWSFSGFL